MSAPTLTYFDFPGGRGEASRLAFHIAGADWVDDRFRGDWPARKPTTPFGGLPVLEVPGQGVISQSNAILGWIGRTHGLLPADPFEEARHVALMNAVEELRAAADRTRHDDEDEKKALREALAAGFLQRWLANVSAEIRGPFVGGDTLSVADLKLYIAIRSYQKGVYDHIPKDVVDAYPAIIALVDAVAAHPRVVDWYARSS